MQAVVVVLLGIPIRTLTAVQGAAVTVDLLRPQEQQILVAVVAVMVVVPMVRPAVPV